MNKLSAFLTSDGCGLFKKSDKPIIIRESHLQHLCVICSEPDLCLSIVNELNSHGAEFKSVSELINAVELVQAHISEQQSSEFESELKKQSVHGYAADGAAVVAAGQEEASSDVKSMSQKTFQRLCAPKRDFSKMHVDKESYGASDYLSSFKKVPTTGPKQTSPLTTTRDKESSAVPASSQGTSASEKSKLRVGILPNGALIMYDDSTDASANDSGNAAVKSAIKSPTRLPMRSPIKAADAGQSEVGEGVRITASSLGEELVTDRSNKNNDEIEDGSFEEEIGDSDHFPVKPAEKQQQQQHQSHKPAITSVSGRKGVKLDVSYNKGDTAVKPTSDKADKTTSNHPKYGRNDKKDWKKGNKKDGSTRQTSSTKPSHRRESSKRGAADSGYETPSDTDYDDDYEPDVVSPQTVLNLQQIDRPDTRRFSNSRGGTANGTRALGGEFSSSFASAEAGSEVIVEGRNSHNTNGNTREREIPVGASLGDFVKSNSWQTVEAGNDFDFAYDDEFAPPSKSEGRRNVSSSKNKN